MKPSMALTLIVCGTVLVVCGTALIITPYIHTAAVMQRVADTMFAIDKPIIVGGVLSNYAAIVCLIIGAAMIIVGVIGGLRYGKSD